MTVKAIKTLTKTSDQDWSGVFFKNISSTVNSTSDPRDQQSVYSSEDLLLIRSNTKYNIESHPGYEGWDREYVGENELKVIYYFSDRINANTFALGSSTPNSNTKQQYISLLREKSPTYSVQWSLVDENGQEEVIYTRNA
jgi:hypothetical protein